MTNLDFESTVLTSLKELKTDVRRLEVLHEDTAEKIDQIIEVMSPEIERINTHTHRIDDHENRMQVLEKTAQ